MLAQIDDDPLGYPQSEGALGIFSVFSVEEPDPQNLEAPLDPKPYQKSCESGQAEEEPTPKDVSPNLTLRPSVAAQNPGSGRAEVRPVAPPPPTVSLASPEDGSLGFHTPAEDVFQNGPSPLEVPHQGASRPSQDYGRREDISYSGIVRQSVAGTPQAERWSAEGRPPPTHLDLLQIPGSEKRLIHHWVTFTSRKLVLIDEPNNPCRSLMLPMALRGLTSSVTSSNADIATFHAICACAAFNLYELSGRTRKEDHVLALHHEEEGIRHLSHNLTQVDQHRDQSFAMAIMACITIEAISGHTRRWRMHVDGGIAYLGKLRSRDISSDFQSHIVCMAILCGCEVPREQMRSFLEKMGDNAQLSFPYYGATTSFLRNMDYMNTLIANEVLPEPRDLDAFELQLYLNFPAARTDSSLPKKHALMLHHMAQAFYYASLVFFQRSVRRAPVETVQTIVEQGVRQLEAIEEVGEGEAGSIMMWPAIVIASECGTSALQARVLSWFHVRQKLGFRNLVVLKNMVKELWQRRENGGMQTSWQDIITEDQFDVFRL